MVRDAHVPHAGEGIRGVGGGEGGRLLPGTFGALVCAQALSLTGEAVVRFALPLHVMNLTGSASLYGLVTAFGLLAYVALTPIGGVMADRVRRQHVMAALNVLLALACAAYLALRGVCDVVALCACVLVVAYGVQGVYQPCAQSGVALVLPAEQVGRGVAVMSQVGSLAGVAGPVLGGLLFGLVGIVPTLVLSAAVLAASAAIACWRLRIPAERSEARASSEGGLLRRTLSDLAQAWRFLREERALMSCVTGVAAANFVLAAFMTVAEPYAVTELLGLPNVLMGVAEALTCAGGLAGAVVAGACPALASLRTVPLVVATCVPGVLVCALACVPSLAAGASFCMLAAAFAWVALCSSVVTVVVMTYVQTTVPHALVGKVLALAMTASGCAAPAGQALWGVVLDALPVWAAALACAGVTGACALAWRRTLARG